MPNHRPLPGSFRDPSGYVYEDDGKLFRHVSESAWDLVTSNNWSQFASDLVDEGNLVPFQIANDRFSMDRLQWITYPYEWSPRQLRAAALLTLDIQLKALECGFSLKDASAFNVQFVGPKPIFIDHLSIERDPGTPWIAYRQFIEHFFAPLMIAEVVSPTLPWFGIDGLSVPEASAILGNRGRFSLATQIHIHQLAKRIVPGESNHSLGLPQQPIEHRRAILLQLRSAILALKLEVALSNWSDYYSTSNYSQEQSKEKEVLVSSWLERVRPGSLVDLGANDGKFSTLSASKGIDTLAVESDLEVVNRTFDSQDFTFVRADLTAPSEGRGWMNLERAPLFERAKADAVLALALIHHLVFAGQIPLPKVVEMISSLGPHSVIEWIEPEDSYAQRLIARRVSGLHPYSREIFETALRENYGEFSSHPISGTHRVLYFCAR